jgi:hypothetical protein
MKRTLSWQQIEHGELLTSGAYGATYRVPEVGRVWVAPSIVREAQEREADEEPVCLMVNARVMNHPDALQGGTVDLADEPVERRTWFVFNLLNS